MSFGNKVGKTKPQLKNDFLRLLLRTGRGLKNSLAGHYGIHRYSGRLKTGGKFESRLGNAVTWQN